MSIILTHTPADIIRKLLVDLGLGTEPSVNQTWPAFSSNEPDLPDNIITVYDTAGSSDGRVIGGATLDHYGFQVKIRSTTHDVGWTKADAIRYAMQRTVYQRDVTLSGKTYRISCISKIGQVLHLGKEESLAAVSKRNAFTINAQVAIRATN